MAVISSEGGAGVGGMGGAAAQARRLEAVDGAGDGPRRDPQAVTDGAERQRAGPAQHPEHLVASEGQPERSQDVGGSAEEDLLGPHDRDDRGHAGRAVGPALFDPALARGFDRVVDERVRHAANLAGGVGGAADHAVVLELGQLVVGDAEGSQHLVVVLAQQRRRAAVEPVGAA